MSQRFVVIAAAVLMALSVAAVRAADPSGNWTSSFDTQIGQQDYKFTFVVKGTTLTGDIEGNLTGKSQIQEGKIEGDAITFVENATVMEMPLRIVYKGKMTSADEIQFERDVAGIANEKLVAKRAK